MDRLVDFNAKVLEGFLQKMVALRESQRSTHLTLQPEEGLILPTGISLHGPVMDEVCECIELPTNPAKYLVDPNSIELPAAVKVQLRDFVGEIALTYCDCPFDSFFHSFDHAR